MPDPDPATTTAVLAIRSDGWSDDTLGTINRVARLAVEAARPLIEKAERQRIRDGSRLCEDTGTNITGVRRYYQIPAHLLDGDDSE